MVRRDGDIGTLDGPAVASFVLGKNFVEPERVHYALFSGYVHNPMTEQTIAGGSPKNRDTGQQETSCKPATASRNRKGGKMTQKKAKTSTPMANECPEIDPTMMSSVTVREAFKELMSWGKATNVIQEVPSLESNNSAEVCQCMRTYVYV